QPPGAVGNPAVGFDEVHVAGEREGDLGRSGRGGARGRRRRGRGRPPRRRWAAVRAGGDEHRRPRRQKGDHGAPSNTAPAYLPPPTTPSGVASAARLIPPPYPLPGQPPTGTRRPAAPAAPTRHPAESPARTRRPAVPVAVHPTTRRLVAG